MIMGRLIVHWSPLHGQCKTTASMSALAYSLCKQTGERVCVTHTQHGFSDLEGMLDGRRDVKQRDVIYSASGLNALITNMKRGPLNKKIVENCAIATRDSNFFFLPGLEVKEYDSVADVTELVKRFIPETVKDTFDWTFVDLASGRNPISTYFISVADVVVVTLSQNVAVWERFFEEYPEIAQKNNVFYLIGGHCKDSAYNVKNFVRNYKAKGLSNSRAGVVPFSESYMDAISDGLVQAYFELNAEATKGDEDGTFILSCIESAEKFKAFADKVSLNLADTDEE